jgi:hypothetical protein
VIALHTVLKELEDELENPDSILNRSGASKASELNLLVRNCRSVLQNLNKLLIKYKSLGTSSKKTWDRIQFGTENLSEIREKLMSHTSSLTLFLTTLGTGSLGRIEKKLDELIADVRAGRKEKSVLTMVDENEEESNSMWNEWKLELVEEGFTRSELEAHKHWIIARLRELIDNGELDETPVDGENTQHPGWKGKSLDGSRERDSTRNSILSHDLGLKKDHSLESDGTDDSDESFLAPADSISIAGLNKPSALIPTPTSGGAKKASGFRQHGSGENMEDLQEFKPSKFQKSAKTFSRPLKDPLTAARYQLLKKGQRANDVDQLVAVIEKQFSPEKKPSRASDIPDSMIAEKEQSCTTARELAVSEDVPRRRSLLYRGNHSCRLFMRLFGFQKAR